MTFTDSNESDQDADLGIPDEFSQRAMLAEAVNKANQAIRELHGEGDGMLAAYIKHAMAEASAAAAELLINHPEDDRRMFELQKQAAGYAQVINWLRDTLSRGSQAEMELMEMDEREKEANDGD